MTESQQVLAGTPIPALHPGPCRQESTLDAALVCSWLGVGGSLRLGLGASATSSHRGVRSAPAAAGLAMSLVLICVPPPTRVGGTLRRRCGTGSPT